MKPLWKYCLAAIVLFGAAACSKDDNTPSGGSGKISIRIAGDPASQGSRIATGDVFVDEDLINGYFICVYDYATGNCEKVVVGDPSHVTVIDGLSTASTKRVLVMANYPTSDTPMIAEWASGMSYDEFSLNNFPATRLWVEVLVPQYGMIMAGEAAGAVTLSSSETTEVTVHLKRVAAKVTLGDITLSDEMGLDPSKFVLKSVSVQRINYFSNIAPDSYDFFEDPTDASFYGGIVGSLSSRVSVEHLDNITLSSPVADTPYTFGNYFYVSRNDGSIESTLLCLTADYDGTEYHYPVIINPPAGGNTTGTTGDYIESNHQYRVNITIKNPIGTNDPDTPITSADLEVTIVVDPWELEIVQNTEI